MNHKISIVLPSQMIDAINERVDAGTYASTSEVLTAALHALAREEGVLDRGADARISEALNDPSAPIPAEDVFERIEEIHRSRSTKS